MKRDWQCFARGADWNSLNLAKDEDVPFVPGYHELRLTATAEARMASSFGSGERCGIGMSPMTILITYETQLVSHCGPYSSK